MKKIISPWLFILVLVSVAFAGLGVIVLHSLSDLPSIDALKNYQPPQSTTVYDRNGEVVGRFFDERRTVISLESVPAHVKHAFIAAEDGDFFDHRGIDYFGLIRAILLEIKHRTIGGRRVGGSTITQQTARTMLLSSTQTYGRKIKEMVLAQRIEKALTKDEILHLYLNQIYFGNGAHGIEEAALTYFSKSATKLTLYEAAALASIPKSPNRINPFGDAERLRGRQHYVLDQMVKHKFIDKKAADAAKAAPLFADVVDASSRQFAPYFLQAVRGELARHVEEEEIRKGGLKIHSTLDNAMQRAAEATLKEGLRRIDKRYGYRGPSLRVAKDRVLQLQAHLDTYRKRAFVADNVDKVWDLTRLNESSIKSGFNAVVDKIRLTKISDGKILGARVISVDERGQKVILDLGSQKAIMSLATMAWAMLPVKSPKAKSKKISDIISPNDIIVVKITGTNKNLQAHLEQEPSIDGGLVALDVETGGILAMVGGYDFERSSFNRIIQAKRQPGSGIKPLIYGLALDKEVITAASIITDAPRAFFDPGTGEYWRPRNHTRKFLGDITVRRCLRSSINICTITLLERLGIDTFLGFAKDIGLNTDVTPFPRNLTIALGSAESYPVDVANAMRIFPNLGMYSPYHMIGAVGHASGVREAVYVPDERFVMRPEAAFITTQILRGVISETDRATYMANVKSENAGKTGTTNDVRSAWFFGYTPKIIALVYVGYDDNRSIGSSEWGTTTAFPIWAQFMNTIAQPNDDSRFGEPANLDWRYVDQASGRVKDFVDVEENPELVVVKEAFIAGTAPALSEDDDDNVKSIANIKDDAAFAP